MDVKIRCFGNLRDYLPEGGDRSSFSMFLTDGVSVREMLGELGLLEDLTLVVVVNNKGVDRSHVLKDQDRVDIFRPSGGG